MPGLRPCAAAVVMVMAFIQAGREQVGIGCYQDAICRSRHRPDLLMSRTSKRVSNRRWPPVI